MRKLAILLFSSVLLTATATAGQISSIGLILSPNLQGKIDGTFELQRGLFNQTSEVVTVSNAGPGLHQVALLRPLDVKSVKLRLTLKSAANLKDDLSESAVITGTLTPGKELRREGLEIVNEDLNAQLSCANVIASRIVGNQLEINLSRFANLTDCSGRDLPEFSHRFVGQRRIDDGSNWFSLADDEKMGREYTEKFIQENRDKILPLEHPTTRYMQEKMELIARYSDLPNLRPKVRVINADVLNAFALPGGYVFVFRGLMEKAPSEAALLGVLGHEWAHVTARHGTRGMTRTLKTLAVAVSIALATQVWAQVTDDKVQKLVLPLIGAGTLAGAQLRLLSKGREQELEADRLGSQYALLANYHPRGIGDMFEAFKREAGGSSSTLEQFLASHPNHDTRIGRNHVLAALFYPARPDYITNSQGFDHALAALTGQPLPQAAQSAQVAQSFVDGLRAQQEGIIVEQMKAHIGDLMRGRTAR